MPVVVNEAQQIFLPVVSGEVLACRTDATSEPGNMLVTVLYNRTPPDGVDPLSE